MKTLETRIQSKRDTTANWNSRLNFIPLKGEIIIYTDREKDENGNDVPGLKIGDGLAYCIDLPFVDAVLRQKLLDHLSDQEVHITQEERERWNNKINCDYIRETLIINRN